MKENLIDRTYSRKTDDHGKSNVHEDISARKMMFIEGNNKGRQDNPDCVKEEKFCTRMRHSISIPR
jgi:hypothetical protein